MSTFEERARARASWPIVATALGNEALAVGPKDATDAWRAVLELTAEAYSLAGFDLSPRPRGEWPARLFRPGEPRPDTNGL